MTEGIQFIKDENGNSTSVVIDLSRWGLLWQEFYDGIISESRKAEPSIAFEDAERELLRDRIDELESELAPIQDRIDELEAELSPLQRRADDLENELESWRRQLQQIQERGEQADQRNVG